MGELRSVARAYALEGHGTVALVERMNGYHAGLGADLMTTMVFAILEIDSGTLRFVNAGHPPPLIVEADGTTRILEGAGPPLGVMDTWRYRGARGDAGAGDDARSSTPTAWSSAAASGWTRAWAGCATRSPRAAARRRWSPPRWRPPTPGRPTTT